MNRSRTVALVRIVASFGATIPAMFLAFVLAFVLAAIPVGVSFAQQERVADEDIPATAQLSLFVFADNAPVAGLGLQIDGESRAVTNENGAVFLDIVAAVHELSLTRGQQELLQLPLNLIEGEVIQILVTLHDQGEPRVLVESSNKAGQSDLTARMEGPTAADGDPGELSGYVFDVETAQPIPGARVFISGTPLDLRSDENGRFVVQVAPGSYSLSILSSDYATQTIDGVVIESDAQTPVEVEMTPAGLELPEFVVLEPFVEGSLASVIEEQRTSSGVTNVLGAEQISRAGDSDAAGALKRVTGLTLVAGQFIYVRGLGERYSSTGLNSASVPSPDPTRRVVPLDLFPTSIIASVVVRKSYSAELPAEFGGGSVGIRTKSIPEAPFLEIGFGLGHNSQTTFKNGLTYPGGGEDWTGFDDGLRDLPPELAEALESGRPLQLSNPFAPDGYSQEELDALGQSLQNTYSNFDKDVGPDRGFKATGGYRWDFDNDLTLGFLASANYGDQWDSRNEIRRTFRLSNVSESGLEVFNDFDDVAITERTIDLSGFLTLGARWGDNHDINLTSTYLRLTEDRTVVAEGFLRDQGGDVRLTELQWEERELWSNQAYGSSLIPQLADLKIDWYYDDSEANRVSPDFREYRQDFDENRNQFGLSQRPGALRRSFDDLIDNSENYGLSLQLPWSPTSWFELVTEAGFSELTKDRDSQIYRLSFRDRGSLVNNDTLFLPTLEEIFAPDLITAGGWVIESATRATDNYQAFQAVEGRYVALNATLFNDFKLYLGARDERSEQTAITFDPFAANLKPVVAELVTDELYPTGTFTWEYNDTSQLRLAYAETVSRPDLRELSEAPFRDPILDLIVIGNPDLIATDIQHIDLRWEKYFSTSESISVALFSKEFSNPIERIVSTGAAQLGTFANALSATNRGVEFDVYKRLGFLWEPLTDFYAAANLTYIESEITLDPLVAGNLTSQTRPLQGQSDIIGNLQIGYDNEDLGIQATLLYNYTGERISDVGTQGIPDLIEQPYQQLDFVYDQRFLDGDLSFKLKLTNLLDDEVEFKQGSETARLYTRGRGASASLEYVLD